jgi:UDP-2,3-diacylglucosamine hydrolase
MIGGNHDAWGGRFLSEHVGMRLHQGTLRTTLGGRPALVAHGDGLGKGDIKYRMLKTVLRSRVAVWGFRALHPEIGVRIAEHVSKTDAHCDRSGKLRATFLAHWAAEQFAADPALSLVICGHSHEPVLTEMGAGRHYVNSGDWVRHRSYLTIADGSAPQLHEWRTHDHR